MKDIFKGQKQTQGVRTGTDESIPSNFIYLQLDLTRKAKNLEYEITNQLDPSIWLFFF